MWGNGQARHWAMSCCSLASCISVIIPEVTEPVVALCHDTDFLFFQIVKRQLKLQRLHSYFFPHSTGINHGSIIRSTPDRIRVEYENSCFASIAEDPNATLCTTGKWFTSHLSQVYHAKVNPQNALPNGLLFDLYADAVHAKSTTQALREICPSLDEDSRIIFSWGRCSRAKGFLPMIQGWIRISEDYKKHVMVIQMPDQSGEPEYYREVARIAEGRRDCILLNAFTPAIWQTFLRSLSTDVVCIPSLADPSPHTPLEAKLFSKEMNYCIVASHIDGIVECFGSDEAVFVFDPQKPAEWSWRLRDALQMESATKARMAAKNAASVRNFNYEDNFLKFLNGFVLPHLTNEQ